MHIIINDTTKLKEIQQAFADFYPYLQIRFYKQPHKKYETVAEGSEISAEKEIGEVKQTHVTGLLEIRPLDKVSDVEKEFRLRFGLSVQILLKEKGKWVQTSGMDDFTLKELNQVSRNASDEFIVEDDEAGFEETNR